MKIEYYGSIADSVSAIKRSGKETGGGSITYDLADSEMKALAAHIPLTQVLLKITVEVAQEMMEPIGTGKPKPDKPAWAAREEE